MPRASPFDPDALVDRVALALHTSRHQVRTAEVQRHALPTMRRMASELIAACEATGVGLALHPVPANEHCAMTPERDGADVAETVHLG